MVIITKQNAKQIQSNQYTQIIILNMSIIDHSHSNH